MSEAFRGDEMKISSGPSQSLQWGEEQFEIVCIVYDIFFCKMSNNMLQLTNCNEGIIRNAKQKSHHGKNINQGIIAVCY